MAHNASDLKRAAGFGAEFFGDLAGAACCPVTVSFCGIVVMVRFGDAEAATAFRRRYRHMLSNAPPQVVAYAVARRPEETFFWVAGDAAFVWDHCRLWPNEAAFLADAVVTTSVFTSREGAVAFHAAAVTDGDGAAALVGSSAAGKSTTAIACARRGLGLYSDEFCVATSEGVAPFPRTLNLRRGGIELLAKDRAPGSPVDAWLTAHRGLDVEDIGWDEIFGRLVVPRARPLRAVFAIVGAGARPAARPIGAAQMLAHVTPWVKTKARGLAAAQRVLELLQGAATFELTLGSPDATASLIGERLAAPIAV